MAFKGFSPFINQVAGYQIVNQATGATSYFGYLDRDGNWYIMKSVKVGAVVTYTFATGTSGYAAAWAARTTQSYDTFDAKF